MARDLLEMVHRAAESRPGRGMRFFQGGQEIEHLTYPLLLEGAGELAGGLVERARVTPGERVALIMATTPACVRAFFGVLAAGAVPVPLPPPMPFSSPQRYAERVCGALQRSRIRLVLGDPGHEWYLRQVARALAHPVDVFTTAELRGAAPRHAGLAPEAPALVQYTSGSTSAPRGVVLSHRQLLCNLDAIRRGLGVRDDDVGCFWLPLFHDMGLIGGLLAAIYSTAECLLMPPEDYVRDPGGWLALFGRYRATISAAPNAAYLQCVRRVADPAAAGLDLSSWRAALCGAEMVDAETMRRFAAHFAPAGFHPSALMPVYGMAEAALAVAFTPVGTGMHSAWVRRAALAQGRVEIVPAGDPEGKEIVSVGGAVHDTALRVLGADGAPAGAGEIGEIHVRGGSLMGGYDCDEEATRAVLRDGWLATGDLGFLQEGRLFVTGRRKEVIIIRGENYYATDIEQAACRVKGVAPQGALALGVAAEGTEALVLLVERRDADREGELRLAGALRESISTSLGISPAEIVMVPRGELPRTSSGKPERHKGPEIYRRMKAA